MEDNRSLTGDVGLSGEDGVLQLVRHHRELVVRRPVNGNGVVRSRAQLLPDARGVGRCGEKAEQLLKQKGFCPIKTQLKT